MAFKILLAKPRGFCAGVDRAISIVEMVLEKYGPPVYVRHAIVHNHYVVESLRKKGVIFVEDVREIPPGSIVIFSAHGVAPAVVEEARRRNLKMIDATCPLVHKVHKEVRRFASKGYTIILVGHRGHVEVEGTMGEAPDRVILVETVEDAERVQVPKPDKVALTTQTTLSRMFSSTEPVFINVGLTGTSDDDIIGCGKAGRPGVPHRGRNLHLPCPY